LDQYHDLQTPGIAPSRMMTALSTSTQQIVSLIFKEISLIPPRILVATYCTNPYSDRQPNQYPKFQVNNLATGKSGNLSSSTLHSTLYTADNHTAQKHLCKKGVEYRIRSLRLRVTHFIRRERIQVGDTEGKKWHKGRSGSGCRSCKQQKKEKE
jgi:hypothetical protein